MSENPELPGPLFKLRALNNSAMAVSVFGCTTGAVFTMMAVVTGQKEIALAYAAATAAQGTLVALNVNHAFHSDRPSPRLETDRVYQERRVTSAWRRLAVTTVCAGAQAIAGINMIDDVISKKATDRQATSRIAPFQPSP